MAVVTITRGPWTINTANLTGTPTRTAADLWTVFTLVSGQPFNFSLTSAECYQLGYTASDLGGTPTDETDSLILSQLSTISYEDDNYAAGNSFQPVGIDLNLDPGAGSSASSKYIAAIMGNILGAVLTKTKPILAALIGKLSITGARQSTYPVAAIIAEVGDGVTACDGAVVAVLGGDSALTTARAAFTADNQNSVPNSAFQYFVDATNGALAGHDGYGAMEYTKAFARMGFDATGRSVILAFGVATSDATILAQVGADNTIADGSIYLSIVAGAGTFWQKRNDVWVSI